MSFRAAAIAHHCILWIGIAVSFFSIGRGTVHPIIAVLLVATGPAITLFTSRSSRIANIYLGLSAGFTVLVAAYHTLAGMRLADALSPVGVGSVGAGTALCLSYAYFGTAAAFHVLSLTGAFVPDRTLATEEEYGKEDDSVERASFQFRIWTYAALGAVAIVVLLAVA
jgi:hypothetical protein